MIFFNKGKIWRMA